MCKYVYCGWWDVGWVVVVCRWVVVVVVVCVCVCTRCSTDPPLTVGTATDGARRARRRMAGFGQVSWRALDLSISGAVQLSTHGIHRSSGRLVPVAPLRCKACIGNA